MSKPYNFFLDIDGTMLPKGKTELSRELYRTLIYAKSLGCKIFINTGRTKAFVPYALKSSDCFDGICCGCGTYIEYQGKVLLENYLPVSELERMCNAFRTLDDDGNIIFEGFERMYYIGQQYPWFVTDTFIDANADNYFSDAKFDTKVHKFSLHLSYENTLKIADMFSDRYNIMIFPHYTEIVPRGFDKGRAIQLTEQLLGIDPELSVAVGDSANDAEMLKYAKTSVAMGNAPDEIKAMCDIVADDIQNEGLAKIITEILNRS